MSTAFPGTDAESGKNPRGLTKLGSTLFRARYRTSVGDSNAANKVPVVIQGAASQTSDLLGVYDSSQNPLFSIDAAGGAVQAKNVSQRVVQVTLTAAQIITLHSVPVALVAAPAAGLVILPTALVFQFKYGTVQMTGGGVVGPVFHGATTNLLGGGVAAATIQAAANAIISAGGPATAQALTSATGIDLYAATADFAAGDSTAIVTLSYDLITLS